MDLDTFLPMSKGLYTVNEVRLKVPPTKKVLFLFFPPCHLIPTIAATNATTMQKKKKTWKSASISSPKSWSSQHELCQHGSLQASHWPFALGLLQSCSGHRLAHGCSDRPSYGTVAQAAVQQGAWQWSNLDEKQVETSQILLVTWVTCGWIRRTVPSRRTPPP